MKCKVLECPHSSPVHAHELVTAPGPQVICCDFNHVFVSRVEEIGFTWNLNGNSVWREFHCWVNCYVNPKSWRGFGFHIAYISFMISIIIIIDKIINLLMIIVTNFVYDGIIFLQKLNRSSTKAPWHNYISRR